jgi:hypothetical protein
VVLRIADDVSEIIVEEAVYFSVSKGLNYAVVPGRIAIMNVHCGVEKAIGTLPEETAEEVRQETFRILEGSSQLKYNLTGAERMALQCLKGNDLLAVLPADNGNGAVDLGTSDYNLNIAILLQDKAYTKLKTIPRIL